MSALVMSKVLSPSSDHDTLTPTTVMRILVVEDEPRLLRNLAKALRESGYAVDTGEAGDDGLFKAESAFGRRRECDFDSSERIFI